MLASTTLRFVTALIVLIYQAPANAEDALPNSSPEKAQSTELTVAELGAKIRKSLVMVRATGRDGREFGHGTGFVISSDGLIATARHVIGDGREVRVELPDGKTVPVTHIHAATESVDVVILRVEASELVPLVLGDAADIQPGQSVVAVGHPGSMKNSLFQGILSGRQEIDEISMLQLAMTIEPGSSGEPVVDRQGRVVGLVTLKSTETTNVGFAVPVKHLKGLLNDPTPIPMSRWMTIGAVDAKRWEVLFGANWRQRAGRMLVDGTGTSFGGRSLCIQRQNPPQIPFEVQVDVKLTDDAGAAGLVFHSDGDELHYGFYPSNGNARLTRFSGPTVYQWTILHNKPHPAYRANEWNTWKVRIEEDRMRCFLNGELVVESRDTMISPGRVGIATYRGTVAEFRRFAVAEKIAPRFPTLEQEAQLLSLVSNVSAKRPATHELVEEIMPFGGFSTHVLEKEARALEARAKQLRQLSIDVHATKTRSRIVEVLNPGPDENVNLLEAALLIAVLDNPDIDVQSYLDRVDQLADEVRETLPDDADEADRLTALDQILFKEYAFRGSRSEYYTGSNSYLNEVIDDREGLPITLSVLYMEIAAKLDLKVVGLGLPGHFVVRFEPSSEDTESQIIDVFGRGERLSREDAEAIIRARRFPQLDTFFEAQSPKAIVRRMLLNLLNLAEQKPDDERTLRYLETLVELDERNPEYRAKRLEMRARTGRLSEAIADADWFIDNEPEGTITDRLYELRARLQEQLEDQ